jgi:hypothetical protein
LRVQVANAADLLEGEPRILDVELRHQVQRHTVGNGGLKSNFLLEIFMFRFFFGLLGIIFSFSFFHTTSFK